MRFLIAIETKDDHWRVVVTQPDHDQAWQRERAMRKSVDPGGWQFPLPNDVPPAGSPHFELCDPANGKARVTALQNIADRKAIDVVEKFGRYLFDALLGGDLWSEIVQVAEQSQAKYVELALRWETAEYHLHRLPWEMMHGPKSFLAEGHATTGRGLLEVAVTRLVANAQFEARPLALPPRVLFVMGTAPNEPSIRPAAEIMGLLRQLKRGGRSLYPREISEATPARLKDTVEQFQPDVVHFICHGEIDRISRRGYLELSSDRPEDPKAQFADQLAAHLRGANGELPALVVLSACYSAGVSAGKTLVAGDVAPLAAELVSRGIPIVIGMSGRVADDACRLFTRRFGDAVLNGEPLVPATAQGRRAVFVEGKTAYASVDWAFPTIFLSERVRSDFAPTPSPIGAPRDVVEERIAAYDIERPPIFCGRNEFFEDYYKLTAKFDPTAYEQRYSAKKPAVLAIHGDSGFGKTRLIEELTAQAIRDGHFPISLIFKSGLSEPPCNVEQLREQLLSALERACEAFGLRMPDDGKLANSRAGADARSVKQALLSDLAQILGSVPSRKPIVLLDEAQKYDLSFLTDLFDRSKNVLGNFGLGTMDQPVPLVLAFSMQGPSAVILKKVLESPPLWLKEREVSKFSDRGEDLLAYGRVLLHPFALELVEGTSDTPWAFNDGSAEAIAAKHQAKFRKYVKGIPAKMTTDTFFALVEGAVEDQYLVKADDESLLRQLPGDR